jgi:hypothetical protein
VRIGNEAWKQEQLDVYGEVLDAAYLLRDQLGDLAPATQQLLVALADRAARSWQQPDAGMWEARDEKRHYTSSKVMCWSRWTGPSPGSASREGRRSRGVGAGARRRARRDPGAGVERRRPAPTRALRLRRPRRLVLLLPLVGFLPGGRRADARDDRGVERELGEGGSSGAGPATAAASSSARTGSWSAWRSRARRTVRAPGSTAPRPRQRPRLLSRRRPGSGELLGNYPQAFSHVGLINAAWRLGSPAPAVPPTTKEHDMTGRLDGKTRSSPDRTPGSAATAVAFAEEGADVVITYLEDADGAEQTRKAVEATGRRAVVVQCDVSQERRWSRCSTRRCRSSARSTS